MTEEDIARLGIRVDTRGADQAAASLDRLSRSARGAERATDNLGNASQDAGRQTAQGLSQAERAAAALSARLAQNAAATKVFLAGLAQLGAASAVAWWVWDQRLTRMQQALNGAGRAAGITLGQMNRLSTEAAQASGISMASSQNIMAMMAGTGRISGGLAGRLTGTTKQFGRAFGLEPEQAGQELAKAFADPVKGAQELNERFGFLDDRLRQTIQRYDAQGDRQSAQNALMTAYQTALAQTIDRTNIFIRALESAKSGLSNLFTGLGKGVDRLVSGPTPEEAVSESIGRGYSNNAKRRPLAGYGYSRDASRIERPGQFAAELTALFSGYDKVIAAKRDKELNDLALKVGDAIRQTLPEIGERLALQDRAKLLNQASGSPELRARLGMSESDISRAQQNVDFLARNFKTVTERMVEDSNLAVRSIMARTLAERMGVDAARAKLQVERESGDVVRANVAAEAERTRILAEATREIRDNARNVANQSELVGLRPLQRALVENEQKYRDMRERLLLPNGAGSDAFRQNVETSTTALQAFTNALTSATMRLGGPTASGTQTSAGIPDSAYYAKYSERAGSMWSPTAIEPRGLSMGRFPQFISPKFLGGPGFGNTPLSPYTSGPTGGAAPGVRQLTLTGGVDPSKINEANRLQIESDRIRSASNITRQTEIDLTRNAQDAITAENALLDKQIATFGMSNRAIAEAAEYQRLYNQATAQGIPVTGALEMKLRDLAAQAGNLAAKKDAMRDFVQTMDDIRGGIGGAISTFASSMAQGKKFADAARAAADSLMNKLIQMATNNLISGLFGKTGSTEGGLFSGLFNFMLPQGNPFGGVQTLPLNLGSGTGGFFANGGIMSSRGPIPLNRYEGGGIAAGPQVALFGEGRQKEAYVPLPDGRSIPVSIRSNENAIERGRGGGGGTTVQVINQSSAQVRTRTGRRPNGREFVEFVISEVSGAIASGQMDQSFRGRYGAAPTKVTR